MEVNDEGRIAFDVLLNDLEIMALLVLLQMEEDKGGLSEPERSAQEKLRQVQRILENVRRLSEH